MKKLTEHLAYWRESYILIPFVFAAIIGAIHLVGWLTGRAIVDDPGVLVDMLYRAGGAAICVALTGITQKALFGYRSENFPESFIPELKDDIHDSCVTIALLIYFSWAVWH